MTSGTERLEGTLSSWKDDRGFGFITPRGGGSTIFVHISAFPGGTGRPTAGEGVSYTIETGTGGKRQAVLVQSDRVRTAVRRRRRERRRQATIDYLAIAAFAVLAFVVNANRTLPLWVPVLYAGTSILCFIVYAADKSAASAGRWRTSESSLLALGLIGGWPGAIIAQQVLRHKTRKPSFQIAFWGTVALNVAAFITFSSPLWRQFLAQQIGHA